MARQLARRAGAAILSYRQAPLHVEIKRDVDRVHTEPVTEADRAANELIVTALAREFPDDGILAEESADTPRRLGLPRVWMIDPLDGTNGFVAGDGDFAVQIGLAFNGRSVLGVVYQPLPDILWWAAEGSGAWTMRPGLDGPDRLIVSRQSVLGEMRLAASRSHRSPRMDRVVSELGIAEEVQRGSVGVKIGLIVDRYCDLYIHLSPRTKEWDTCAPEIILREGGGRITDLFGRDLRYNRADIQNHDGLVASNGAAHEEIIERLAPLLREFDRRPMTPG